MTDSGLHALFFWKQQKPGLYSDMKECLAHRPTVVLSSKNLSLLQCRCLIPIPVESVTAGQRKICKTSFEESLFRCAVTVDHCFRPFLPKRGQASRT